jgi:hypothetical protein
MTQMDYFLQKTVQQEKLVSAPRGCPALPRVGHDREGPDVSLEVWAGVFILCVEAPALLFCPAVPTAAGRTYRHIPYTEQPGRGSPDIAHLPRPLCCYSAAMVG